MKWREMRDSLRQLVDLFVGKLPSEQIEFLREDITAGEYLIALDHLCSQLYEFDISVPSSSILIMEKLGRKMGLDPSYWENLTIAD